MASQKCSNCAAALPLSDADTVVACQYCGTDNRIHPRRQGGTGGIAVFGVLAGLLVLAGGVFAFFLLLQPVREPAPPSPDVAAIQRQVADTLATLPKAPPPGGVAPSELGTIADRGWVVVNAPEIDGTFAAFDPVANLPWAMSMARAWSTDARLGSLYIDGVRADGGLDVSARDDWDVDYRFFSPTLRASAKEMAKVSEEEVHSELRLMVSEGRLEALLSVQHGRDRGAIPEYAARCTFAGVMSKAAAGGLRERPTYDLMLTWVSNRWRWHVGGKDIKSVVVFEPDC